MEISLSFLLSFAFFFFSLAVSAAENQSTSNSPSEILTSHHGHHHHHHHHHGARPGHRHPHPASPEQSSPWGCGVNNPAPQTQFWMAHFPGVHEGVSPYINTTNYPVWRNVKHYGAVGDGVTDDTAAFNRAIKYGGRASGGDGPGKVTGQPALIYVPAGEYLVSSTIQMFVETQMIGDAINLPVIKAASTMPNNGVVLSGFDPGTPSTTNFYIGVRNLVIDTTSVPVNKTLYALNWAVSQGTSLFNVNFVLAAQSNHVGIEMNGGAGGGGSGLFMGDLVFSGGLVGIQFNNQQYSMRNVSFTNVVTGIAMQHEFVVTLQQVQCTQVDVCIDMGLEDDAGSMNLIDSTCDTCDVFVNGTSSILLENINATNTPVTLRSAGVNKLTRSLVSETYVSGHVYETAAGVNTSPMVTKGKFLPYTPRGSLVDSSGYYFTKPQPQYTDYPASAFSSVKDNGAKGDGKTDDTAAIQTALLNNANCQITYIPFGIYIITDTIYVPPGSRIVGEVWSTLSASGAKFRSADAPRPMLQIGRPGDVGVAELSDLLFTIDEVLPGAILTEINMHGAMQGDVSLHNTVYRIGGAQDSKAESECQSETNICKAAFLGSHLGRTSSAYIENSWIWSADHDLDNSYAQQVGTGRGMLIEARESGTWLVGTASEHHVLYAYQFYNAQNVFSAVQQVETPYWQPSPRAPAPWTPNATWHDPTFAGCNATIAQCYMSWALRVVGPQTHTLALYGQGFWVYFNGPNYGACTGPEGFCQVNIIDLQGLDADNGEEVELYNVNTRGVENLVTIGGSGGRGEVEQDKNEGSWGGVIAAFLGYE